MSLKLTLTIPKPNLSWWKSSKKELDQIVERHNRSSWGKQRDPVTGDKWKKRKEPTGSWPLLNKTGKMLGKTKFKSGKDPMSFMAKSTDYAKFHQKGTSKMPQRRFLGVGSKVVDEMAEVIGKHIFKGKVTFKAGL